MQGLLDIVRKRWTEVLLLLALSTASVILFLDFHSRYINGEVEQYSPARMVLITAAITAFSVIWLMMQIGFVRSVFTHGAEDFSPGRLLSMGRLFFWRFLGARILVDIGIFLVAVVLMSIVVQVFLGGKTPEEIPWYEPLIIFFAQIVLMKPLLLLPGIILVWDCKLWEAFYRLREYRIFEARQLVGVFLGLGLAVAVLQSLSLTFISGKAGLEEGSKNVVILQLLIAFILSLYFMSIWLLSMKFVARRFGMRVYQNAQQALEELRKDKDSEMEGYMDTNSETKEESRE